MRRADGMDLQKCQQFVSELALLRDEAGANSSPANVRSVLKRLALIYDVARNSQPEFAAGIFQAMAACLPVAETLLETGIAPGSAEMAARQAKLRQALDLVVVTGARLAAMAPPPPKIAVTQTPPYQAPPLTKVSGVPNPVTAPVRSKSETPAPSAPTAGVAAMTPRAMPTPAEFDALKRERDEALKAEIEARTEYHTACQQLNRLREENTSLQQQVRQNQAEQEALRHSLESANRQAREREAATSALLSERERRIAALENQSLEDPDPTALQSRLQATRTALPKSLQQHVDGLLELMQLVRQGDMSALAAKLDAIDRFIYGPPETVGVLMAKGLTDVSILHSIIGAQRLLHTQLTGLGLTLICPAAGDPFDAALHLCPERDIVYVNEGPREDRVLALTHIGFRNARTDAVLRRALVKRSVYVGDIDETEETEPAPAEQEPVEPEKSEPETVEQEREANVP